GLWGHRGAPSVWGMRQPSLHPGPWAGPTGRTTESAPGINSIACGGHLGQAASVRGQSNQVLSGVLRAGRASTAGLSPLSTPDSILICYAVLGMMLIAAGAPISTSSQF